MRVLVCGGRDYRNWRLMDEVLSNLDAVECIDCVISGHNPKGADNIGERWARKFDPPICVDEYPAQWDEYGKRAGPIRNQQMLDEGRPDLVLAFGGIVGTPDMVNRAHRAGVAVEWHR